MLNVRLLPMRSQTSIVSDGSVRSGAMHKNTISIWQNDDGLMHMTPVLPLDAGSAKADAGMRCNHAIIPYPPAAGIFTTGLMYR